MAPTDELELARVRALLSQPPPSTTEPSNHSPRRSALEQLMALARCEDAAVKAQVGELLARPFAEFRDLQEKAVDAVYDLCEDGDAAVRRSGYACFALLSRASPSWVQRNTDVLSQLLAVDGLDERQQIRRLIGEHVAIAPAPALGVVFDVLEDSEADPGVQRELIGCLTTGQLKGTGAEWESAMQGGCDRLLASTTRAPSAADALELFSILSALPLASTSNSTDLSAKILSYPSSSTTPYAHSDGRYLRLASALPHDPRALVLAHVAQLDRTPFNLPESSMWAGSEGTREKAFVAAVREWAEQAPSLPGKMPALADPERWDEVLRTIVDRLQALAMPRLRRHSLPFAALEFLLGSLYYLSQIPQVNRSALCAGSPLQREISALPYPRLPGAPGTMSTLQCAIDNLIFFFRFFARPELPTERTSTSNAASSAVARFTPSWILSGSRSAPSQPRGGAPARALPGPRSSTMDAPVDRRPSKGPPSGPSSQQRLGRGQQQQAPPPSRPSAPERRPSSGLSTPRDQPPPSGPSTSRQGLASSQQPRPSSASGSSSLLSRISPTGWTPSPSSTPAPTRPREQADRGDSTNGIRVAPPPPSAPVAVPPTRPAGPPPTRPASAQPPVHVAGKHYGAPGAITLSIKGRGSVHAPPLPTEQPAAPTAPTRGLLERLSAPSGPAAMASGGDADMGDLDDGGRVPNGGRKRKSGAGGGPAAEAARGGPHGGDQRAKQQRM